MTPHFQITTTPQTLKLIPIQHASLLYQCVQESPSLQVWMDWCCDDFGLGDAEDFIMMTRLNWTQSKAFGFGVFLNGSNTLLGMVSVNELYHTFNMASVGYWISDQYQRQGFGKEALQALVDFCFNNLSVTRLEIVCDPDNIASQQLACACNAKFEVLAENRYVHQGTPKAGMVFSILPA